MLKFGMMSLQAKAPDRVKILHLSDLHFEATESDGETTRWEELTNAAKREQPDLIVVTGDLVNSPTHRAYGRAKEFLLALCEAVRVIPAESLRVVPGNHDYRFWGLGLSLGFVRRRYQHYFGQYTCGTHFLFRTPHRADQQIAIYCLDTNGGSGIALADGLVLPEHLTKCAEFLAVPDVKQSYSVVLMHHHPAPLPRADDASGVRIEQTMILRNAATVIDRLLHEGADLVLHGHKHWEGITRISMPSRDGSLAIVAAGSAGKPSGAKLRFNTVEILRAHTAVVRHFEALPGHRFEQIGEQVDINEYRSARERKRKRLIEAQKSSLHWGCRRADYRCQVKFPSGDVHLSRTLTDVRLFNDDRRSIPIAVRSSFAERQPAYVLEKIDGPCDFGIKEQRADSRFETVVEIKGDPSDRTCGAFSLTAEIPEAIKMSSAEKLTALQKLQTQPSNQIEQLQRESEHEYFDVRHGDVVAEHLTLVLELPDELFSKDFVESFRVMAYDYSSVPHKRTDLTAENLADASEGDHAAQFFFRVGRCQVVLYLDKPLPGYRYRISWRLPEARPPV